jgi:Helicase associated domain
MSQRRQYMAFMASSSDAVPYATSCLNRERVQKLLSLGLDFNGAAAAIGPPTDFRDDTADPAIAVARSDKRKMKTPPSTTCDDREEEHTKTRRPPKKRKNSLDPAQTDKPQPRKVSVTAEAEQRDAPTTQTGASSCPRLGESGERDDVSPTMERPIKGLGDSAWETLMQVSALMPKLPTVGASNAGEADLPPLGVPAASPVAFVSTSSPSSTCGSPQTKRVKSKYGDLDAWPNAGCSYSSKYRAANNDVVPNQQRWEDMFVRLVIFKDLHGHCRVPNRYPDDPSLGSWGE